MCMASRSLEIPEALTIRFSLALLCSVQIPRPLSYHFSIPFLSDGCSFLSCHKFVPKCYPIAGILTFVTSLHTIGSLPVPEQQWVKSTPDLPHRGWPCPFILNHTGSTVFQENELHNLVFFLLNLTSTLYSVLWSVVLWTFKYSSMAKPAA